jgi:hypothetical protein
MYLILLVVAAGMAITIERWFSWNRVRSVKRKM